MIKMFCLEWRRLVDVQENGVYNRDLFLRVSHPARRKITSLLRQSVVATSLWRNNDVIIASCARCLDEQLVSDDKNVFSSNEDV